MTLKGGNCQPIFQVILSPPWYSITNGGKGSLGEFLPGRGGGRAGGHPKGCLYLYPNLQLNSFASPSHSPSILPHLSAFQSRLASQQCWLQGPEQMPRGNLAGAIFIISAKVAMETLHPFRMPAACPSPPLMLCPSAPTIQGLLTRKPMCQ